MIELAVGQCAIAAVKESERGSLDAAGLQSVRDRLRGVRALLARVPVYNPTNADELSKHAGATVEPKPAVAVVEGPAEEAQEEGVGDRAQLLDLTSRSAPLLPFEGFGLLAEQRSTRCFSGGATEACPEMFVDLTSPSARPNTLSAVARTLRRLKQRCDALRSKSTV